MTSVVSTKAKIDSSNYIGPNCIIEDNVEIGKNNKLTANIVITGNTKIGNNNTFYPFSTIGTNPQDLKYKGEESYLYIGNNNTFREYVTVNTGTEGGGLETRIENNCLFMVSSHIAHDCIIKSNVILANNATLAGHVEIFENAIIGGNSAIHQHVKIGKYAMIGGMSGVEKNIIPYSLYTGIRSELKGINIIGLKRKGLNSKNINLIIKVFKKIFDKSSSIQKNIDSLSDDILILDEINEIIDFIKSNQKRGICRYIDE